MAFIDNVLLSALAQPGFHTTANTTFILCHCQKLVDAGMGQIYLCALQTLHLAQTPTAFTWFK